jgi:Zn-dependent protease with chaperone function
MTEDKFDALVKKLEEKARNNPSGYKKLVLMTAFLGNAYILSIVLLLAVVLIGLIVALTLNTRVIAIKLILMVGAFLWMILRALWVKISPPSGTRVTAKEAPALFDMINDVGREMGAPRFHQVLIDETFNAAVVQSPRLGLFGWHRNYLLIGLPLMKALTVEQFKAVLAHEFGHLSKGHGRMSNWIYRQRLRWARLLAVLEASTSRGSFLFMPFLNWFAPYFNAVSFPLARANEYEADAASVRLTSSGDAAQALTAVSVVNYYLNERFWPGVSQMADDQPQPGFMPYSNMGKGFNVDMDEASVKIWLDRSMAEETTSSDTHPALKDRLSAMGETPRLAPPAPGESSDRLLGDLLETITREFDRQWKESILPAWEERHREVREGRENLARLNARVAAGAELPLKEAFDRAILTESFGKNPDGALSQLKTLQEQNPDNALICLSLGSRLLSRNDETGGFALVERSMELDDDISIHAYEVLRDHHFRNGRVLEADEWHRKLMERGKLEDAGAAERNLIQTKDTFDRHDLDDTALEPVLTALKAIDGLRKAYLVKKRVRYFTHRPLYILGFSVKKPILPHNKTLAADVQEQIRTNVPFPGETTIFCVDGENYRFGRKFRWMKGSRIL